MADPTSKEKCRLMILKLVETSLEDHYSGDGHKERCKNVLALDAFAHLRDRPNAAAINEFVGALMQRLAKECWEAKKTEVYSLIETEMGTLVEELLTEEEAQELLAFGTSQTGQKVFRNLDLMRNVIAKGRNIMTGEIVMSWSDPAVSMEIDRFINNLGEE